ncbi:hypothetical protein [Zeaxanthinibacter enoshimensis]|uniref:Uncharacterized protein n=1 Tax=Zeaxanthinibacter enoshimensis TaxID=392009 RepID=A0A4R6TIU9_9FLAO|nr:hypothetical protein [Zeaxanthinibacter enoshimensis]TDQ30706.1 hypothetical protein CLV82_1395 [Zeaxanthinibacter enoshimensis]
MNSRKTKKIRVWGITSLYSRYQLWLRKYVDRCRSAYYQMLAL